MGKKGLIVLLLSITRKTLVSMQRCFLFLCVPGKVFIILKFYSPDIPYIYFKMSDGTTTKVEPLLQSPGQNLFSPTPSLTVKVIPHDYKRIKYVVWNKLMTTFHYKKRCLSSFSNIIICAAS